MSNGPDSFIFLKQEKITPKRVGVLLDALDALFANYNIDVPADVELSSMDEFAVQQASEEDVAKQLSFRLEEFQQIIAHSEVEGLPPVPDQLQARVIDDKMFLGFLARARSIRKNT